MARATFAQRSETFGFDSSKPWALDTLRLLFNVPRLYEPLLEGWEYHYPHTRKRLDRLAAAGFVAHQAPVLVNTRTGELADVKSTPVTRWRTTAAGHRVVLAGKEDLRSIEKRWPSMSRKNAYGVLALLDMYDLAEPHSKYGISMPYATSLCDLAPRTARWWTRRFEQEGLIRQLDTRIRDTREVIPAHWRVTRTLTNQLRDVLEHFRPGDRSLHAEWRLHQHRRYLTDIDPSRLGLTGATDFDHDINTQAALSHMLKSSHSVSDAKIAIEPRIIIRIDTRRKPWRYTPTGRHQPYQPDALLRERHDGMLTWAVIEYEHRQTRRDGWDHIERFLGWAHQNTLAFEPVILRFVLDSPQRLRAYTELIEAFCDYMTRQPQRMIANPTTLACIDFDTLATARDALDLRAWTHIELPSSDGGTPVSTSGDGHIYDEYFGRAKP